MGKVDSSGKVHATLSPSGADRWMTCSGSVKLSQDIPDKDNDYSIEGTDHHEVAAVCLEEGAKAADMVGRPMLSGNILTEDGAKHVQSYVDMILGLVAATGGSLLVEQAVPLEWLTGEKDAHGTADAVIITQGTELIVADLKYGMGVEIDPERNKQAMIYALGVLHQHELWDQYKTVRIVISQPRTTGTKEWVVTLDELRAFEIEVRNAALNVRDHADALTPSEKACKFCPAKGVCPALGNFAQKAMTEGFEYVPVEHKEIGIVSSTPSGDSLGAAMAKVPLLEEWIKGVRAEVERQLLAGRSVTGFKLVQGKKGARKWVDDAAVEELMRKSFRMPIEEVYDMKVISPTSAEKVFKETPKRWGKLQGMITQTEGVPSVAPESDKRPALVIGKPEDGFETVTNEWEDLI